MKKTAVAISILAMLWMAGVVPTQGLSVGDAAVVFGFAALSKLPSPAYGLAMLSLVFVFFLAPLFDVLALTRATPTPSRR